jgi:hypothetical protein
MSINWQEVITTVFATVGAGGVILAAAAWLAKAIVTDRMAREAELFKTRLQTDASTEIEKLRSSLQLVALEHQVRFSKLHERRAEAIADIYRLLVEVQSIGRWFALNDAFGDSAGETYERFSKAASDLHHLVQLNRLYLPERICRLIEGFSDATSHNVRSVQMASMIEPRIIGDKVFEPGDAARAARTKMFHKAWDEFEKNIPAARRTLEDEFRELLGGMENPNPKLAFRQEFEAGEQK